MTIELGLLIAVFGFSFSAASFFIGRTTASRTKGREEGSLHTDISYIKQSLDRIDKKLHADVVRLEARIDDQSAQLVDLMKSATGARESSKSSHKRLDQHLEREHDITVIMREA